MNQLLPVILPRLKQQIVLLLMGLGLMGCFSMEEGSTPDLSSSQPPVAFTDITEEAGLEAFTHETGAYGQKLFPESMGAGGGFIDYNNDGWLDILLVGGALWPHHTNKTVPAVWLYRNNQDGGFTLQTKAAGLDTVAAYGMGVTVADYDNDQDEDFYLTTLRNDRLFRNDNGTFTEVSGPAGLANDTSWSTAALFFDANRDGWLDLYVGKYVEWSKEGDLRCSLDGKHTTYCTPEIYNGLSGRFYMNSGDGTFTDQTRSSGIGPAPGMTLGAAALDYNEDGWTDFAVANDTERDLLYRNKGDGSFEEIGMISGMAFDENGQPRAGMGIDGGVTDSSGNVTLFIGNFSKERIGAYRYEGKGVFADRAVEIGISRPSFKTLTFGLFLSDVDLDGDLDLFAANGHIQQEVERGDSGIRFRQAPQLYLNKEDGTFEEVGRQLKGLWQKGLVARGSAYGDIDRDGDPDVLITENGGPAHLWRNDLRQGSFVRVALKGRTSHPAGIGARVEAFVDQTPMVRYIRTGSSYLSASETDVATFGLGTDLRVDSLHVHWPSGAVNRVYDIEANRFITVHEGKEVLEVVAGTNRSAP